MEKAYAEWNQTGNEGRDGQNAYASLAAGCMQVVDAQVLGGGVSMSFPSATDTTAKAALIAAVNGNLAVTVGSNGCRVFNLVGDHAYVVSSYSAATDTFQLTNPWGFYEPLPITYAELCTCCDWVVVADTAGTAAASGGVGPEQSLVGNAPIPTVNVSSRLVAPKYAIPPANGSTFGTGIAAWGGCGESTEAAAADTANDGQLVYSPSTPTAEGVQISGTNDAAIATYWGSERSAQTNTFDKVSKGNVRGIIVDRAILQFLESSQSFSVIS